MKKSNPTTLTKIIIPVVFFLIGAFAGWMGGLRFGGGAGVLPLSDCEVNCIKNNPNDPKKRLDCMLKCIASGN